MGKKITITCDCQCGAKSGLLPQEEGWFVLSQAKAAQRNDDPKLDRKLYFKTLECISRWVKKACEVVPNLPQRR